MTIQTLKTPKGETLVVMSLDDYEDLRDGADYAKARDSAQEFLTEAEVLALVEAPTPLAFWRRKRELTQVALAEATGVSQSYIADIERGARKGEVALYKKLASALGVRMEDLVAD